MLTFIMEDEQCFIVSWSNQTLNFIQRYDITLQQLLSHPVKDLFRMLNLASLRRQRLCIGLPPSCYQAMILPLPAELSEKDVRVFCQIKMANALELPQAKCQVMYYPLKQKTVYAIGYSQLLLHRLQQLARYAQLQLQIIDLTIYGVLTSVSQQQSTSLWIMPQGMQWTVFQQEGSIIVPWQSQKKFLISQLSVDELLQQVQRVLAITSKNCFYLNTDDKAFKQQAYQTIDVLAMCKKISKNQRIDGCELALLAANGLYARHQESMP